MMEQETEEVKIEIMKKRMQELIRKNDAYIPIIKEIIEYERDYPNTEGWQMEEIESLNGGYLARLIQYKIIVEGRLHSNKYREYLLAEHWSTVFQALDEIEGEREGVAVTGKVIEEPLITEGDIEEFKGILATNDAIDYWSKFVAPAVCGLNNVKDAILVQLASPDDTKNSRGRIHILLEGEPGTGKTMFREWVTYEMGAEYASMRGTIAGLTRDMRTGNPGALDRAHASVWRMIGLEELKDWDKENLDMMKESMSNGKYPLQGSGTDEIVDAMVKVLACTNEIESKKFSPQFLDRFDMIIHFDRPSKEQANPIIDKIVDDFMVDNGNTTDIIKLKKYLWWTKQYKPDFPKSVKDNMKILIKLYKDNKYKEGQKVNIRVTIGGLLRIAYTIARLNHRPVDVLNDGMRAIKLVDPDFDEMKLAGISTMYKEIIERKREN